MKIFLLFSLLLIFIGPSISMTTRMQEALQIDSKFSDLSTSALGRMLQNLIELHMEIGGPVEELMQAVDEFINELEVKKQREVETYERLRAEYMDLIQQFEFQISKAKLDIQTSESKIEIILEPRLEHLKEAVDQMQTNIEENDEQYSEESQQRDEKHRMFLKLSTEFQLAIETVEQAMELIIGMEGQRPSFVQVNKAKKYIGKLKGSLDQLQNQYSPIVATLVNLSQEEFDNPEVLSEIISLLKQLQEEVSSHYTLITSQEAKESESWETRSQYLTSEHMYFIQRKSEYTEEQQQTELKIQSEINFKESRQEEMERITGDMKQETEDWAKQTEIHDELMRRIENDHNLTLVAKQNILQHKDVIERFAEGKRKSIEWKQKEKLWD